MFLFLIVCYVDDMYLQCMLWREKNRIIDDNLNMEVQKFFMYSFIKLFVNENFILGNKRGVVKAS